MRVTNLMERMRKKSFKVLPILLAVCFILGACAKSEKKNEHAAEPQEVTDANNTAQPTHEPATPTPAQTPEPTPAPTPEPTQDPYSYDDLIASVYGYTNNRSDESLFNIDLICEKIDGLKIMPGEVFSFNETVGKTTEDNGFKLAEVYASYKDEEVYQYGGGASLVASTLYCAGLYGVLTPVERYQHHFYLTANGYLQWGSDAYVCNDGQNDTVDMKIKNAFSCPVMIKAWNDRDSEKIHVEIYGTNPDKLRGEPRHSLTSYYLQGADWVNDRFSNEETRVVYDSQGILREDDLHEFDKGPDGDIYYYRHLQDYVW